MPGDRPSELLDLRHDEQDARPRTAGGSATPPSGEPRTRAWLPTSAELLVAVVVAALVLRPLLSRYTSVPVIETWATVFVSIAV